jgi:lipid A 3-O-deacylase
MKTLPGLACSLGTALSLVVQSAGAQALPASPAWSLSFDNDQFALVGATEERWYTQGLRVQRVSAWGDRDHLVLSFTHLMFTPASTRTSAAQPLDRPYAGAMYAGLRFYQADAHQRTDLGLELGVIGPSAGAASLQRAVHRVLDQPLPLGWGYQLPDQPWAQASAARVYRLGALPTERTDLLLRVGALVGHPRSEAQLGLSLRTGALPQAVAWPGDPVSALHATPHWMAHARVQIHGVFSDALLEGRPQASVSEIQRRPAVLEGALGASWRVRPALWLDASVTWRARDFEVPSGVALPGSQRWGSLQLRWIQD